MEALINIITVELNVGWKIWFCLMPIYGCDYQSVFFVSMDQWLDNWHSIQEAQGLSPGLQFAYSNENEVEHH